MDDFILLTYSQAARLAGMSERTLRRRVSTGELPTRINPRDRRRVLIRLDDLQRYLGEGRLQPTL